MFASVRAMFEGIVDYAGMFPPARLSLEESIRNYARYREEPDAWMLGRFVCPVTKLDELASFAKEFYRTYRPFAFSVIGKGGDTSEDFLANLFVELEAIVVFEKRYRQRVVMDSYEVRLPDLLVRKPEDVRALISMNDYDEVDNMVNDNWHMAKLTPYYEVHMGTDWKAVLTVAMAGIAKVAGTLGGVLGPPAFKLRCGGEQPAAIPSAEQVACAIVKCRDALVRMKFTAGLHHAMRHFNRDMQMPMHGFLNVFAAGILAHVRQLDEARVEKIIEEQDPESFFFDDTGFGWKEVVATTQEIKLARQMAVISFGSCSFDEPREDLRSLGLIVE